MSLITNAYGNWLTSMKWDYNATLRRHFAITEFNIHPLMDNLIKYKSINKLFCCIEEDRNDNMTHLHLLIDTNASYSKERLSKEIGVNKKTVSYLDRINDINQIGHYVTKDFWKRTSFYDIRFK
ncbi:hypothetical protein [Pontimicrobium aquaticum]|uniref:Uncharacterized protein n=1 Tax=Pontimicrobium aquaticum TaxID=2565367 RepID=A0A4U0F5S8_9FLAO|nr:hypothetical protein [Pontimicrobium aquaticum]TJY38202.1 hypothetical protein E5167_02810 [Pontimicrobium aquaticum]